MDRAGSPGNVFTQERHDTVLYENSMMLNGKSMRLEVYELTVRSLYASDQMQTDIVSDLEGTVLNHFNLPQALIPSSPDYARKLV
jgi:hypothetical protein